jgi:hypothetical protein
MASSDDQRAMMSFIAELKRRNVVRVGVAYTVISWLLAQVAEFAFENFGAPEWVGTENAGCCITSWTATGPDFRLGFRDDSGRTEAREGHRTRPIHYRTYRQETRIC